jgi:uncharacterized protein YdgA (DUF945 family)
VTNKEILRLKLVPRSKVEEMAQMLALQGRRLRELEAKLQQEQEDKANLEMDFQNLLDQLELISPQFGLSKEQAVVCG